MNDMVKSKIANINFDEKESILYLEIVKNADMTVNVLKEHYEIIKKIIKGKKYYALVDVTNVYRIGLDGVEYAASTEALENRMATAYCCPPLANRLNINFLKNIHEPAIPMDIFSTREQGLAWLRGLQDLAKNENYTVRS